MELKDYAEGLLAFYFPPEEQARLMGLSAAMNQMGGVVATLLAGPYKVGIVLCLIFLVQVYFTRHFQSLPPNK